MALEQMTQSRTLPAGDVFCARLILMLAKNCRIAPYGSRSIPRPDYLALERSIPNAACSGLAGYPTPGPEALRDYAGTTGQGVGGDSTQAERRIDALVPSQAGGQLGISKGTVERIWRKSGLKPH